jgi:hypothetical protein
VAIVLLGLVFLLITFVPLWHTDIWGHLAFGRWITDNLRLPHDDPVCAFAEPEPPSILYCWLGQTSFYLLYHVGELLAGGDALQRMAGGVELLRLGHALIVVLRCLVLLAAFRRLSGSLPLACAGLGVLLVLSLGNIAILRPQVLSELFFALVLLALSRPVLSKRSLVLLPLLFALWANVHGSWAIGLVLLAACLVGRSAEVSWSSGWQPRRVLADAQVRRLLPTLLLSVTAVALLNPAGPWIFANTLQMAAHPNVLAMDEWQPLEFSAGAGGHWAYLATLLLAAVTLAASPRWFSPTTWIVLVLFAVQPLRHQRMLVWWLMLTPWLLMPYWAALAERRAGRWPSYRSVPSFRKTLLVAFLAVFFVLWSMPGQWLLSGHPGPLERTVSAGTPWQLAAQLREPGRPDAAWLPELQKRLNASYPRQRFTGCVFASETLGDYLVWALPSQYPVFIYTHVHLFAPANWQACTLIRSASPGWRSMLDRFRINLVLVEPDQNPRLCAQLKQDTDWQVLLDETGLATKRDRRNRFFLAMRVTPR